LFVASLHHSGRFPAKVFKGGIKHRPAGVEYNRSIAGQTGKPGAYGFPHAPAYPVPHHSFTDGAGQCETDSGRLVAGKRCPKAKCGKVSAGHAGSRLINFAKFGRPEKTVCLWK
jgi:hypothetical protein